MWRSVLVHTERLAELLRLETLSASHDNKDKNIQSVLVILQNQINANMRSCVNESNRSAKWFL